ncbi:transposase domain-containing protein [Streptomyces sp. TLI_55]|uniref:transposase domain-containing protein n=1 Tax=Streptomyces sp. TLI_55 TaxID=1938861 RepID=UPI0015CF7C6C|nr:transposase domain-containing protein [Streptomyces sp. TLI_55]
MDSNVSDRIAVRLLVHTFPPDLVDHVVAQCGRAEQRRRMLPARTVVYFVLAMSLFCQRSYKQIVQLLADSLAWSNRGDDLQPLLSPTTAALSRARARLGPEPLAALFTETVQRSSTARPRCERYRTWRVLTADTACVDIPDTPDNRARYSIARATSEQEPPPRAVLPQVRISVLAECGSHTITSAAVGLRSTAAGPALSHELLAALAPGDLVLAECEAAGLHLLPSVCAAGADLLWWIKAGSPLPPHTPLPDGSYLSGIGGPPGTHHDVRLITEGPDWLVTTLLDHEADPGPRLAALARQYRNTAVSFQAIGTLWHNSPLVLRSRWPAGVEQEIWAHLLVHHTLQSLMHPP